MANNFKPLTALQQSNYLTSKGYRAKVYPTVKAIRKSDGRHLTIPEKDLEAARAKHGELDIIGTRNSEPIVIRTPEEVSEAPAELTPQQAALAKLKAKQQ